MAGLGLIVSPRSPAEPSCRRRPRRAVTERDAPDTLATMSPGAQRPDGTRHGRTDHPKQPVETPDRTPRPTRTRAPRTRPRRTPGRDRAADRGSRHGGADHRDCACHHRSANAAPAGTYVCDTVVAVSDPLDQGWRIQGVRSSGEGGFDRVIVTLARIPSVRQRGDRGARPGVAGGPVADTLHVVAPSDGRAAIALRLGPGVRLTWDMARAIGLSKVRWATLGKDDGDIPWLVLGVAGGRRGVLLAAGPTWSRTIGRRTSIEVTLDIQR